MNRTEFDIYLAYFNARNYEKTVQFFTDNIVLKFAGYEITGKDNFLDFYRFFHRYVNEKVLVHQFAGDNENVIIDAVVRLEGRESLPRDILKDRGFGRLAVPGKGEVMEIPQFIHYREENCRFAEIRCVIKQ